VVLGIAEVAQESKVYNTAVVFGPKGFIKTQDKRNMPTWNDRGVLPFSVIQTPYGNLGVLICSDSYQSDWARILTLEGADIILMPANWWGEDDLLDIWRMRAKENGVWLAIANRWGSEVDNRYTPSYSYDMNDAPSAIINDNGKILQSYKAKDNPQSEDKILYQTISVPKYRIGTTANKTYSVNDRNSSAYGEIANQYYDGYNGNLIHEGLPTAGNISVTNISYKPSLNANTNIKTIKTLWGKRSSSANVVVLPGFGITSNPIVSTHENWYSTSPISSIQNFVDSNSISLLVSTVKEQSETGLSESLIVFQSGKKPQLIKQIHNYKSFAGSGAEPYVVNVLSARIGIITGQDSLFPEITTALAKAGADIILIPSTAGNVSNVNSCEDSSWNINDLETSWKIKYIYGVHIVASDWTGNGIIMKNSGWSVADLLNTDSSNQIASTTLDTSDVREKYLSSYYSFDLDKLLNRNASFQYKIKNMGVINLNALHRLLTLRSANIVPKAMNIKS
jgi:predicted amidohydrolase